MYTEIISWLLMLLALSLIGLPISNIIFTETKLIHKLIFGLPLAFLTTGLISLIIFIITGSLVIGCIISLIIHSFFLVNLLMKVKRNELRYMCIIFLKFSMSVFLLYIIFLILRGFNIGLSGTEKLSDQMHLSSVYWANNGIIKDLWFSGKENPYYFYGYWMYGSLIKTIGIDPILAYSIILATNMAISAMVSWTAAILILNYSGFTKKYVKYISILSPLCLLVVTNYSIFWEILNVLELGQPLISNIININGLNEAISLEGSGWRSTRIINYFYNNIGYDYTIQEYPSFSFHLGDLHPHFISIPYLILVITIIIQLFVNIRNKGMVKKVKLQSMFIGLIIPVAGLINIWDLPLIIFIYSIGLIFSIFYIKDFDYRRLIFYTISGTLLGFIILSKYYLFTLGGQTKFPFIEVNRYGSNILHFLTIWGFFMIFIYIEGISRGSTNKKIFLMFLIKSTFISIFIIIIRLIINIIRGQELLLNSYYYSLLTLVLLIFPLILILSKNDKLNQKNFIINFLIVSALGILLVVENIHLIDSFGNRMNTIFKSYYQVWVILSISFPLMLNNIYKRYKGYKRMQILYLLISITFCLSLVQNYSLLIDNSNKFSKDFGFNNVEYMNKKIPGVSGSIDFLIKNTNENSIIYSGIGADYTDSSYISVFTGRATPLGWPGHESQWRANDKQIYERKSDLEKLENSNNEIEILNIISKYNIDYYVVFINQNFNRKLQDLFLNIYSDDQVIIYKTSEIIN